MEQLVRRVGECHSVKGCGDQFSDNKTDESGKPIVGQHCHGCHFLEWKIVEVYPPNILEHIKKGGNLTN